MSNAKAHPRAWEVTLAKVLDFFLGPSKLIALVYAVVMLFATTIVWSQVGILYLIAGALHYCQKNNNAILEAAKNDNNSGE